MKTIINIKTRRITTSLFFTVVFAIGSAFFSCEEIIEGLNIDCIGNIYASLPAHQLETGYLEQYYYDELMASVENEPHDDSYDYYFSIQGPLPSGIEVSMDKRILAFEGRPLESGTFKFEIILEVEPYYPETNICVDYDTSKEYTLYISK